MPFVRTTLHTSPVCFHIDSKYGVKYGSRSFSLPRSVFFPCHRFAEKLFHDDIVIPYINIVPAYEKEREVDGVQSKNLPSHKIYCISLLFRNIIDLITLFLYDESIVYLIT